MTDEQREALEDLNRAEPLYLTGPMTWEELGALSIVWQGRQGGRVRDALGSLMTKVTDREPPCPAIDPEDVARVRGCVEIASGASFCLPRLTPELAASLRRILAGIDLEGGEHG